MNTAHVLIFGVSMLVLRATSASFNGSSATHPTPVFGNLPKPSHATANPTDLVVLPDPDYVPGTICQGASLRSPLLVSRM